MVRNSIASKLETLPTWNSDRITSVRLPLNKEQYLTLFSVYVPTVPADPEEKDKFYSDLRGLLQNTPADDEILILGDFNARVGQDSEAWKGVLGKHGVGGMQRQWTPTAGTLHRTPNYDHQHHLSSRETATKQHGCILGQRTATFLTTCFCDSDRKEKMFYKPEWCPAPSAIQSTVSSAANSNWLQTKTPRERPQDDETQRRLLWRG